VAACPDETMPEHPDYKPVDLAREAEFLLGATRVSPASRVVFVDGQPETFEPRVCHVKS
jgi:hypothetical protein